MYAWQAFFLRTFTVAGLATISARGGLRKLWKSKGLTHPEYRNSKANGQCGNSLGTQLRHGALVNPAANACGQDAVLVRSEHY